MKARKTVTKVAIEPGAADAAPDVADSPAPKRQGPTPWYALHPEPKPLLHRQGALLLREALERKDKLFPLIQFEVEVANHTGDLSRLCGVLDGMLAVAEQVKSLELLKVTTNNKTVQFVYDCGRHRQRAMLPWLEYDDGMDALSLYADVCEVAAQKTQITFAGVWS